MASSIGRLFGPVAGGAAQIVYTNPGPGPVIVRSIIANNTAGAASTASANILAPAAGVGTVAAANQIGNAAPAANTAVNLLPAPVVLNTGEQIAVTTGAATVTIHGSGVLCDPLQAVELLGQL